MTEPSAKPRSRRIYVLWAIALTLLISTGLFCWLVVVPFLTARSSIRAILTDPRLSHGPTIVTGLPDAEETIAELGGPEKARRVMRIYYSAPGWIAPGKNAALHVLAACGKGDLSLVEHQFRSEKACDRIVAAYALANMPAAEPSTIPLLAYALDSEEDFGAKTATADALRRASTANPAAVAPLGKVLAGQRGQLSRQHAAAALGHTGARQAMVYLRASLKDRNFAVRLAAAEALKKIRAAEQEDK